MDYIPNNFKSLSELFDVTLSDLKGGIPLWDDLVIKITRLHAALRGVVQANSSFLEAFQRIADLATNSSGLISKDIGTSLTRLSLRQRSLHAKMKLMNENMGCRIIDPMQQRLDEWKKNNLQLDKDRIKETRRAKNDLRKATDEKNRLQRKAIKRGSMKGLGPLQMQVEVALKEAADKYQSLENIEYDCVRRVLIEERSRFCYFISCLMPVLECQLNMFSEMGTLQELKDQLTVLTDNPHNLTQAAEDLIKSIVKPLSLSNVDTMLAATFQCSSTPPPSLDTGSSEGSLISSRKSSVLSINSEASSSHSGGVNNLPPHRRSLSESPTHALIEQESDEIFICEGRPDKDEFDVAHYSQIDPPDLSHINNSICKVANVRDYDSVTLKRPKTTSKCLQGEEDIVILANLSWQPDTPNVNANYSALYQLHHPIQNQSNCIRKNSGPLNGNIYPEYHTIHSSSPSSKPRRMTVPELPVSVQTYATIKHQNRINVMHPPNVQLHQIEECRLPPNPNEENNFADENDLPMPPPPSMEHDTVNISRTQTNCAPIVTTPSVTAVSLVINATPATPVKSSPVPPPPPCAPPPLFQTIPGRSQLPISTSTTLQLQSNNNRCVPSQTIVPARLPPSNVPVPPPPPPPPAPSMFSVKRPIIRK